MGRVVPQSLLLGVGLDEPDLPFGSAGQPQVGQRLGVDGKDRTGRAVFRAHVADGRAGGQRHVGHARAVEVDELADHPHPAQQLRHREDQIGRGAALPQVAGELDADDLGDEHAHRLAEHGGFGLDAADAPAQHAQPVDHRGVRVGADQGVRIGIGRGATRAVGGEHDPGQVLEVHLVADAGVRRHDEEVVEGLLRPPQQLVTLLVAVELQVGVAPEGVGAAEDVGDDRVVDDQLGRDERVDPARVAAEVGHGVTHRDQIHHTGHPGEVLQQHPRRRELNLGAALGRRIPGAERVDLLGRHQRAVLVAQQVLQQHLQAVGQPRRAVDPVQPEHLVGQLADRQPLPGVETVPRHDLLRLFVCVKPRDAGSACDELAQWDAGVGQCCGIDPFAGADELLDRLDDVPDVDVHPGHHAVVA